MMPTTRLTAVKTTSGSDAITSPSRETQVEPRQARFEARKKPEPLTDASPVQKLMIQFLEVVLKYIFFLKKNKLIQQENDRLI